MRRLVISRFRIMNHISLLALLEIITTFQLVFFSVFLVTFNKGKRLSNILLGLFLFFLAVSYQHYALGSFSEYVIENYPSLFHFLPLAFQLTVGPFLYFYIKSYLQKDYKIRSIDSIHFLPFLGMIIYLGVHFFSLPFEEKQRVLIDGSLFNWREYTAMMSVIHIQSIAYIVASLAILRQYRIKLLSNFAELTKHNLSWLSLILFGVGITWFLRITNFWIWVFDESLVKLNYDQFRHIQAIVFLIFSSTIVFRTLREPEVFYAPKKKYSANYLSNEECEVLKKKLLDYMEIEKPYLNPELNLKMLSDEVEIPQHHISQLLGRTMAKNFFDFVNSYRIMESKILLLEHSSSSKNISEIMYEVGFNSKSVFNTMFKKVTGMTPTQFRKFRNSA